MSRRPIALKTLLAPLKPLLLPLYNGGHRLAGHLAEHLGALARGRVGRCNVCGRVALMLRRPRVIPAELRRRWGLNPELAEALVRKESLDCSRCGAKLRARRLAQVLLELYPVGSPPRPARSLAAWVASPEARALRVAEINLIDGLHPVLARLPNLSASDFREPGRPAAGGLPHQDLSALTYPDASFDLILTSETLEHVPDLALALAETRRVLAPGGVHLFTIPALPGVPATFARARLAPDGSVQNLAPPIAHPGGDRGYPVFTEFGADLPQVFLDAGFRLQIYFGPPSPADLAQVYKAVAADRAPHT